MTTIQPAALPLERVRQIAIYQRVINVVVLANLVEFALVHALPADMAALGSVLAVLTGLASAVAVVLLARALHGFVVALICVPMMFVPMLNIITLLVLNHRATVVIRRAGYRVGLLGADPSVIG